MSQKRIRDRLGSFLKNQTRENETIQPLVLKPTDEPTVEDEHKEQCFNCKNASLGKIVTMCNVIFSYTSMTYIPTHTRMHTHKHSPTRTHTQCV